MARHKVIRHPEPNPPTPTDTELDAAEKEPDELTAPGSPFASKQELTTVPPAAVESEDPRRNREEQPAHAEGTYILDPRKGNYAATTSELADFSPDALIEGLGQRLRDSLNEALERGVSHQQLLYTAKVLTGGRLHPKGSLIFRGVEAFLEKKGRAHVAPTVL